MLNTLEKIGLRAEAAAQELKGATKEAKDKALLLACLLYTSPSPRD